jgi:hypothetical protein
LCVDSRQPVSTGKLDDPLSFCEKAVTGAASQSRPPASAWRDLSTLAA